MLVFGAVQFKSSNGGIEIIHDGTHQWLSWDELGELSSWISHQQQTRYNKPESPNYPIGRRGLVPPPGGWEEVQADANL